MVWLSTVHCDRYLGFVKEWYKKWVKLKEYYSEKGADYESQSWEN